MTRYNEELTQAGALLAARRAAAARRSRVSSSGVTDGPFSEAKELVGGYWIIQAKDREEAVEWAKRVPAGRRLVRRGPPDLRDVGLLRGHPGRRPALGGAAAADQGVTDGRRHSARSRRSGGSSPPRLIAALARMMRDVGVAEDLAQDALVAALEKWPQSGVPDNPGAWLMTAAKHRAIDLMRRSRKRDESTPRSASSWRSRAHDEVGSDDLLSLIFTCCHPVLSMEARVALTLRMLGGLSTPEIARAFLVPEATVAQRIVRAKKALAGACRSRSRTATSCAERLAARARGRLSDLQRGLRGHRGRRTGCGPRCARTRCGSAACSPTLAPREGEVWGLLALMEIQASRMAARVTRDGTPILLLDQDRSRWDRLLIQRGCGAARAPRRLGLGAVRAAGRDRRLPRPRAHARRTPTGSGSPRCTRRSPRISPSPVVELNRAVALGMAFGPARRPRATSTRSRRAALDGYHLLPSVRGDLLAKLGRADEARAEFERAAALTANAAERELLLARAQALA